MLRMMIAITCVVCASVGVLHAEGPYDSLLKYAPGDANVLALIDVKGAFSSPLAKKENWAEKGQPNNRGGLGFLPSDAELVAIAAEVHLNSMRRNFEVGLIKLRNVPPMREISAREGGTHDEIAGRATVLSPRDVYFTALSASELAASYPADRQSTARWIRAAKAAKTSPLSAYLKSAADTAAANTVTIALDLEDAVDKTLLRFSLPASPAVAKNKNLDLARLANVMASVKGMVFTAKVDQAIKASMTWDFGFDPGEFRKTLPNMVLELIDGQGVTIPDLELWEATFTESSMTLSGSLTSRDLKRIVSLFAFPSVDEEPSDPEAKDQELSAGATKRYYSTVDAILLDISKTVDTPSYAKTATWHEKAAAQIEHLSRQRVDPIAIDAALQAAKRLRAIGASLRGVPIDAAVLENQQYLYTFTSHPVGFMPGGWWGWRPFISQGQTQVATNIPAIQASINKLIADDEMRRGDAWSQISKIMVEAKKALVMKYKITF